MGPQTDLPLPTLEPAWGRVARPRAGDSAGAETCAEASVGRGDSAGSVLAQGRDEHNVGANAKTRAWTSRHGRECQAAQAPSMEVRRRGRRDARLDKERRKEINAWPSG